MHQSHFLGHRHFCHRHFLPCCFESNQWLTDIQWTLRRSLHLQSLPLDHLMCRKIIPRRYDQFAIVGVPMCSADRSRLSNVDGEFSFNHAAAAASIQPSKAMASSLLTNFFELTSLDGCLFAGSVFGRNYSTDRFDRCYDNCSE